MWWHAGGDMLVAIRQVSEIVQYEGNCLPRLYLLVTVGMVWDAYADVDQIWIRRGISMDFSFMGFHRFSMDFPTSPEANAGGPRINGWDLAWLGQYGKSSDLEMLDLWELFGLYMSISRPSRSDFDSWNTKTTLRQHVKFRESINWVTKPLILFHFQVLGPRT